MDQARITIQSLAHGGDGVSRLPDGRTVFVPYSCPGDELTITVTEDHGRWARATIDAIEVASPDRTTPACPYFGACGGCQWQHISYSAQAAAKRQTLIDALTRIGKLDSPDVAETVASPSAYGYRNKVELTAAEDGSRALGFLKAHTNELLAIDACPLLPKRASRLPRSLTGALRFLGSRGAEGILRASVRVSASGEIAVDVWTRPGPFPRAAAARVITESTGARTFTRTIMRDAERRDVSQVEVLAGTGVWHEKLGDDRFAVSSPSFFQVNTAAAIALRDTAVGLLEVDGTMRVADLYAGVGTFTLPLARSAGEVVAVEASRYALGDLRENLAQADLDADIVPGDAAYALPDIGHLDAALIDPPRSGISDKAMRALIGARIPRIVYVSCDPATLARDVAALVGTGYHATRFVPVDLFPQTYHLETVALLERV
ncbi:MAG: 23S rRNA (uracil(1939)-C(5))-methyltransferase RlmD [Coriobacteriia bacterium]|nr:23S rRNA (uracil(1939)-C(5))-methyltransferase RlmD [Coriobacteriia bacterium]